MVLILDDNSKLGAHIWSENSNSVCLRHLFISTENMKIKFIGQTVKIRRKKLIIYNKTVTNK